MNSNYSTANTPNATARGWLALVPGLAKRLQDLTIKTSRGLGGLIFESLLPESQKSKRAKTRSVVQGTTFLAQSRMMVLIHGWPPQTIIRSRHADCGSFPRFVSRERSWLRNHSSKKLRTDTRGNIVVWCNAADRSKSSVTVVFLVCGSRSNSSCSS
jgi:hypothetical protein